MRIALWQTEGFPANVAASLDALNSVARSAAQAGAGLLLCPECWLCGYHIGEAVKALAEARDGPSAQRIAAIARQNRLAIAYGYAEREQGGPLLYNAVQVMGPEGQPLGHYRKTHLFGPEERAAYCPGRQFEPPFSFGGFRIGLLICYDVEFPESVRTLALMGADLVLVPTATSCGYEVVTRCMVPTRAVENQLHLAYCNHAGVENGLRYLGGSCLVGPDGHVVVSAGDGEALLIADTATAERVVDAKLYPYRGDRRPELYGSLSVAAAR